MHYLFNTIGSAMKILSLLQTNKKTKRAVCASLALTIGMNASAGSLEQAKRIHDRLTGVPPSESSLIAMKNMIDEDGNGIRAALYAIDNDENHDFYNVTLKNWIAPATNREGDVFADLNDYIATLIGAIEDDIDFRTAFYDDILYVGANSLGLPAYANDNNAHYLALEAGLENNDGQGFSLKTNLEQRTQTSLNGLSREAVSGVVTSRAAAKSFFIAGTNRANFRFTLLNHLCVDLEQVHDVTLPPDRIRQDVSRSPGGDSRVFLNTCIGCHNGMDPMAQAFAYHNYVYDAENDLTGENGFIEYIGDADNDPETGFPPVQPKYLINSATFANGFITPNSQWENRWRQGQNSVLGWDESLPGSGEYAWEMVQELVHSEAFASCQVNKVFKAVCLREPHNQSDIERIHGNETDPGLIERFKSSNYSIKTVFAETADYCKGE